MFDAQVLNIKSFLRYLNKDGWLKFFTVFLFI